MEEITIFYCYFLLPLLLLIVLKCYKSTFRPKNLPPSPKPTLPIIGHLRLLKPGDPVHRIYHNLAQTYGPIISLKFGSRLVVVVSSFSVAEECFTKNDIVLANRPHFIVGKHLAYNNTSLAQSPYGDHWRNLRRISTIEILSTHRLNMLLGIRKDEIKRQILKLASLPGNSTESSGFAKVEVKKVFQELTFNIMMRMVAGKRYHGDDVADEEEAREFREIINEAVRYGGASNPGDYLPILNWIDFGDFEKRVIKMAKRTDSFLQKLVDEGRRKRKEMENTDNMMDHLLSLQESQPEYYTDEIIKGLTLNMLLAGTDTSAVTLEWAMSNLLNHPETLRKAKDEIDYNVGQEVLIDEPKTFRLHYLQSIITETLRLYPAAPLLLPHMSSDDCTISGYTIPRDAILLVNAWAIHRDPQVWNDAASFKPERYEKGENEAHKMMPFGLGRRSCPGSGLAQRVVSLTLGSMLQCFEWEMVPGEKEIDMTEARRGIVMHKGKALEATCRARPIVNKILGISS